MALIKCSEYGQIVSDKATTCPHCGKAITTEVKEKGNGDKSITFLRWSITAYALVKIIIDIMAIICDSIADLPIIEVVIALLSFIFVIIGVQYMKKKICILAAVGFCALTLMSNQDIPRYVELIKEGQSISTQNDTEEQENVASQNSTDTDEQYNSGSELSMQEEESQKFVEEALFM